MQIHTDPFVRWGSLWLESWLLSADAAVVIALRLGRLAALDSAAVTESRLMVDEKVAAALELQWRALTGRLGARPHLAAGATIAHYRRAVRANRRRLSR